MTTRNIPARALLLAGAVTTFSLIAPMAHAQSNKQLQQEITTLQATVASQGQQITTLQSTVTSQGQQINALNALTSTQGTKIATLQGQVASLTTAVSSLQASFGSLSALGSLFTVQGNDVFLTGNLHIINGSGGSYSANGLGNLFLGYQSASTVTGSHNLIAGLNNTASGCNSLVSGDGNKSLGNDQVVLGGNVNTVYSVDGYSIGSGGSIVFPIGGGVIGGANNTISDNGTNSVIVGGTENVNACDLGVIVSGEQNTLSGFYKNAIIGGFGNLIDGGNTIDSVICAGNQNHIDSYEAFAGGGVQNHISGPWSATLAGHTNAILATATASGQGGGNSEVVISGDYFGAASTFFAP